MSMNDTIRSILAILESDKPPELKIAAAQVLGEIAPKDAGVVKALAARLELDAGFLARHLLSALASIGSVAATRILVAELDGQHTDLVAHLLAEMGADAVPVLAETFEDAGLEARLRILGILGRHPGPKVAPVAEKALVVPELARRAGEVLVSTVETLDGRQLRPLKTRLVKALSRLELAPQCAAAILAVVARVDAPGSRATLIKHAGADHPAMVRQAALFALRDIHLTPTQAGSLLGLLGESDDVHVVEPVLEVLEKAESWPPSALPVLRRMLASRPPRLRVFAARALRYAPHAEVVKPLVQLMHGDDPQLAAAASHALGANAHARETLLRSILHEKDLARARRTAEPLARLGRAFGVKEIRSLVERGAKLLLAHDPMGELVLSLLVRAQPEKGARAVVEKAVRLRRQRKHAEAIALLAFLAAGDHIDPEGRYQLALTRLLFDSGESVHAENGAAGDATMGYFALLIREGFPMFERLRKESMVEPEDLLRVGQHFVEAVGDERRFGVEILHHIADKHARRRAGDEARLALRSEGH